LTELSFERELKNKLSQKSSGTQSEETVLMKSFKYFDLNNNGTVEPEEFAKAIEKIGIMIPTRQVSAETFIRGRGGAGPETMACH
jgi:Ca2+-binding EF-hand superfamily protein